MSAYVGHECEEHRRIIRDFRTALHTPEAASVRLRFFAVLNRIQAIAEWAIPLEHKLERVPKIVCVWFGVYYDAMLVLRLVRELAKDLRLVEPDESEKKL